MTLTWTFLPFAMLVASLTTFAWAMRKFFFKPSGDGAGMKMIRAFSSVSALLHLAAILATPESTPIQILAAASLYASGLALFFWALRANRERRLSAAFSLDSPRHLVTWGPYRFIRHPFYTAYLMTWTAGFAGTGRLWLLPTIVAMVAIYARAARMEEGKFAESPLAGEYRAYHQVTGRFLPNPFAWIRRRKEADASSLA